MTSTQKKLASVNGAKSNLISTYVVVDLEARSIPSASKTWPEICDLVEAELEEERLIEEEALRLGDLERNPWKTELLPHCKALALLPIGHEKIPVDLETGWRLKGWPSLSFSIEEIEKRNEYLQALAYRPGPESGHIACLDIDGTAALAWLEERGAMPADAGWVTLRGEGRLKVHFRIPAELREQLPLGKRVFPVVPAGKDGNKAQLLEFFNGSGQCVIAGRHPSGVYYVSVGNPKTVTEPNEAWTQALIEIVAKSRKTEPAGGEEVDDRWQSGPQSPCPVCGRDTTTACTNWVGTDKDGSQLRGVNCFHGIRFSPPLTQNMGCFGGMQPLERGEKALGADGGTWVFIRESANSLGTFSTFIQHRQLKREASKESGESRAVIPTAARLEGGHFAILGWTDGARERITYRAKRTGQISVFSGRSRTELLRLAPLEHWIAVFSRVPERQGEPRQAPVNWDAAISAVISEADRHGVFDQGSLRGHGVWLDQSRTVWHLGDRLEVDGEVYELEAIKGKYNYVRLHVLGVNPQVTPLQNNEGEDVLNLIRQMGWASQIDHLHLAGWLVLANVGGALPKRPGLQITSSSGSGKSDCVIEVIQPLLAGLALYSTGSTEAGVRQALGTSSLPALIDESEQENPRLREGHLHLMRLSYDGVAHLKGTQNGDGRSFAMRSSICLVGINATIPNPADRNRTVVVSRRQIPLDEWNKLATQRAELITRETGERLLRRTVCNLMTLVNNVQTFGRVVARRYNGRAGDTYGALLAGAHHLTSLDVLDEAEADRWIDAQQWTLNDDEVAGSAASDEAEQCLEHLLKYEVPLSSGATVEGGQLSDSRGMTSIREVVSYLTASGGSHAKTWGEDLTRSAQNILGRIGLKVDNERGLLVHTGKKGKLLDIFEGTRWAKGAFKERLLDLPDAVRVPSTHRFPSIGTAKCIALPLSLVNN